MTKLVNVGDLKSPGHTDLVGSNPILGTHPTNTTTMQIDHTSIHINCNPHSNKIIRDIIYKRGEHDKTTAEEDIEILCDLIEQASHSAFNLGLTIGAHHQHRTQWTPLSKPESQ